MHNGGLSGNSPNIGALLGRKNVYFVPFCQDDEKNKPTSVVCDMAMVYNTYLSAMDGRQIQPILFINAKRLKWGCSLQQ